MAGLSFRVGETKTTKAGEFEIEVETRPPALADPAPLTLGPGTHRFQLVVEDEAGRRSKPATVEVTVVR